MLLEEAIPDAAWCLVLDQLRPPDAGTTRAVCRAWHRDVGRSTSCMSLVDPCPEQLKRAAQICPMLTQLSVAVTGEGAGHQWASASYAGEPYSPSVASGYSRSHSGSAAFVPCHQQQQQQYQQQCKQYQYQCQNQCQQYKPGSGLGHLGLRRLELLGCCERGPVRLLPHRGVLSQAAHSWGATLTQLHLSRCCLADVAWLKDLKSLQEVHLLNNSYLRADPSPAAPLSDHGAGTAAEAASSIAAAAAFASAAAAGVAAGAEAGAVTGLGGGGTQATGPTRRANTCPEPVGAGSASAIAQAALQVLQQHQQPHQQQHQQQREEEGGNQLHGDHQQQQQQQQQQVVLPLGCSPADDLLPLLASLPFLSVVVIDQRDQGLQQPSMRGLGALLHPQAHAHAQGGERSQGPGAGGAAMRKSPSSSCLPAAHSGSHAHAHGHGHAHGQAHHHAHGHSSTHAHGGGHSHGHSHHAHSHHAHGRLHHGPAGLGLAPGRRVGLSRLRLVLPPWLWEEVLAQDVALCPQGLTTLELECVCQGGMQGSGGPFEVEALLPLLVSARPGPSQTQPQPPAPPYQQQGSVQGQGTAEVGQAGPVPAVGPPPAGSNGSSAVGTAVGSGNAGATTAAPVAQPHPASPPAPAASVKALRLAGHSWVSDRALRALAQQLPGLSSLSLGLHAQVYDDAHVWGHVGTAHHLPGGAGGGPFGPVTATGIEQLLYRLPHLRHLSLPHVPLTKCAVRALCLFRHLESLDVSGCPHADDSMLFHLHCAGGLQSLGLAGCGGVSDIGLARIARSAPRLTSLNLSGCSGRITDVGVSRLGALRHLRTLSLAFCDRVTDAGIYGMVSAGSAGGCPLRLTHLDLTCCCLITDSTLLTLARHAPRLRRLQLDCLTGVSAQGMQALACLSHLEALSVQETKGSVQAAARALARALLGARLGPACTIPRGPLPSACMGYAAEGALQEQQQREAGGGCLFPGQVMVGKQGEGEVEWCNGFVPLAEAAALQASVGWWMLAPES